MRKIIALLLALMLCLSMTALAASNSKSASDGTDTEVRPATPAAPAAPAKPAVSVKIVSDLTMTPEELAKYGDHTYIADAEVKKLAEAASVADYFGEVKNAAGEPVDLQSLVTPNEDGTPADLSVYEFYGLVAENYEESMGKLTVDFKLPTPYKTGDKVGVMIGLVTKLVDDIKADAVGDKWDIKWTAVQGTVVENTDESTPGVEELTKVEVELEPATIKAVQDGTAMMAVVSKTNADAE